MTTVASQCHQMSYNLPPSNQNLNPNFEVYQNNNSNRDELADQKNFIYNHPVFPALKALFLKVERWQNFDTKGSGQTAKERFEETKVGRRGQAIDSESQGKVQNAPFSARIESAAPPPPPQAA